MLGSTRSLTLCAWGSSRLPLLNRSNFVCVALTGCPERSSGWMCPRAVEGWRGVGQRHPQYQQEPCPPMLWLMAVH